MAKEKSAKERESAKAKAAPSAQMLANYVKDISFENIAAQNDYVIEKTPNFEMNLNINNKKLADDVYEVSMNVKVKATDGDQTIFILDLEHAGRFRLINVEENAIVPFLYIECPRLLFPYTRRIVSTTTMDGGLVPLNLENVDFVAMFQNSVKRAQEEAEKN